MEKLTDITKALMDERFGKDSVIALATTADDLRYVRYVNAYYQDGAFYVITYALSGKMKQMAKNPAVAIAGDWFTARGVGENLGYIRRPENAALEKKLREAFAEWIDNGHNNFDDVNTCILCIRLTEGVLFSHGTRYDIDFTAAI
ncbi:MAG TPA: pyridoxamine 5'-phosphate oxidase family protein [Candidatus Faecaligallichristensenella faecipullorum]|nr:pyridoxamine 5'-phosphate oxidase family protein [Candidatus Faecaligallichristensenella faecipullorum]